jgi:hypothetical protein
MLLLKVADSKASKANNPSLGGVIKAHTEPVIWILASSVVCRLRSSAVSLPNLIARHEQAFAGESSRVEKFLLLWVGLEEINLAILLPL